MEISAVRNAAGYLRKAVTNPVVRTSLALAAVTVLVKMTGYAEKLVLAYKFGTGYQVDIYQVVSTIILSVFLFYREVTEPGFLNAFLRKRTAGDHPGAWAIFNRFFRYILVSAGILTLLVFCFPQTVMDIFVPGFHPEKKLLAATVLRWSFPAAVLLALSTLTNISLNGLKIFAVPALGELLYKAAILAALMGLYAVMGMYAFAIGFVAGALLKLGLHVKSLSGHYVSTREPVSPETLRQIWQVTWPVLTGVVFSQLSSLIDMGFSSHMQDGAIAALSYAKKIVELPVLLFPYILSVAVFPHFSELAIARKDRELHTLFVGSMMWITLVFLPLAALFGLCSYEITAVLLKRGAFDELATLLTARPLLCYAPGLPFFAAETVLVIYYFSMAVTRTPIFIGILCAIENVLLTMLLIRHFDYLGIALAFSIAKATKVIVLLFLLRNIMPVNYAAAGRFLLKALVALLLMVCAVAMVKHLYGTRQNALFLLALCGIAGTAVYGGCLLLLNIRKELVVRP